MQIIPRLRDVVRTLTPAPDDTLDLTTTRINEARIAVLSLIHDVDRDEKIAVLNEFMAAVRDGEIPMSDLPVELRLLADSMEPF